MIRRTSLIALLFTLSLSVQGAQKPGPLPPAIAAPKPVSASPASTAANTGPSITLPNGQRISTADLLQYTANLERELAQVKAERDQVKAENADLKDSNKKLIDMAAAVLASVKGTAGK